MNIPIEKKSEYWLSIVVVLCASVMLFYDKIDGEQWMILIGAITGAYTLSRGVVKGMLASGTTTTIEAPCPEKSPP